MKEIPHKQRVALLTSMACSYLSTGTAVVLFNPLDCLRIRWQITPAELQTEGILRFGVNIIVKEGLWAGLWVKLAVNECNMK
jgi:hypothetical protein